jgi:glycosyltransferase involved in cell wall biosynthesis
MTDTNIGGAGKCVLALADWANGGRYKGSMEVVLPIGSALKPEFESRGVPVTELEYLNDRSYDRRAVAGLEQLIRGKKPQIVHTHAALSARIAARNAGNCKVVYTRHCVYQLGFRQTFFPRRLATRFFNNRLADAIIAVSPAVEQNLIALGAPRKKIHIIYNGVPRSRVIQLEEREKIRLEYGLSPQNFIVSIMARLVDDKDHDTVLDAAKLIGERDNSVTFVIAGAGPNEERLKARVANEGIKNVKFLGFIQDIERVENITNLQINASVGTEATSMALISGFSLGIPAVVSDFGGNPYVVADGIDGFLFPCRDSHELAESIMKIRRDRDLYDKMSFEALEAYETRFTLDIMGQKTFGLYEELLKS